MLIGDIVVWCDGEMIAGLSGDRDVSAEYAERMSRDLAREGRRGLEVVWSCRNGDPRDVRMYVDGAQRAARR